METLSNLIPETNVPPSPLERMPVLLLVEDHPGREQAFLEVSALLHVRHTVWVLHDVHALLNWATGIHARPCQMPTLIVVDAQRAPLKARKVHLVLRACPDTRDLPLVLVLPAESNWGGNLSGGLTDPTVVHHPQDYLVFTETLLKLWLTWVALMQSPLEDP